MKQLLITEFLHFRKWAVGIAVFQFLVLYYLFTLGAPITGRPLCLLWMTFLMFSAAGFGFLQMKLHKRPNDWLYLIHKPLSHQRIFAAITSAGVLLILIAGFLPALANIIIMDIDGMTGIELRHYGFIGYVFPIVLIGYFCGCHAALSPNRLAFLVLVLGVNFMNTYQDSWIVTLSWLVLLLAGYLAWSAFKPDLDSTPQKIGTLLAAEFPIQYAILWGSVLVMLIFIELSGGMYNTQPQPAIASGGEAAVVGAAPGGVQNSTALVQASINTTVKNSIRHALELSDHPDAKFLMQQVNLAGVTQLLRPPDFLDNPKGNQLPMYDNTVTLMDEDRRVRWQFLHGDMLFEGRDLDTKSLVGWMGPGGFFSNGKPDDTFTAIPWVTNNRFVTTGEHIYHVDLEKLTIDKRYRISADDRFRVSLNIGEHYTTQTTDNRLYIFDTREFHDLNRPLEPLAVMPYPGKGLHGNRNTTLLQLIDGILVSTRVGWNNRQFDSWADLPGYRDNYTLLYRVVPGREPELITYHREDSDVSDFKVFNALVASPGLRLATDLLWGVVKKKDKASTLPLFYVSIPGYVLGLCLLAGALSAACTAYLLRKSALPNRIKGFWIVLTALTGLPGLLSFLVGSYWRRGEQMGLPHPVADRA